MVIDIVAALANTVGVLKRAALVAAAFRTTHAICFGTASYGGETELYLPFGPFDLTARTRSRPNVAPTKDVGWKRQPGRVSGNVKYLQGNMLITSCLYDGADGTLH